jgi:hypothetical protein
MVSSLSTVSGKRAKGATYKGAGGRQQKYYGMEPLQESSLPMPTLRHDECLPFVITQLYT